MILKFICLCFGGLFNLVSAAYSVAGAAWAQTVELFETAFPWTDPLAGVVRDTPALVEVARQDPAPVRSFQARRQARETGRGPTFGLAVLTC